MKKLIVGLLTLGSISSFAEIQCHYAPEGLEGSFLLSNTLNMFGPKEIKIEGKELTIIENDQETKVLIRKGVKLKFTNATTGDSLGEISCN